MKRKINPKKVSEVLVHFEEHESPSIVRQWIVHVKPHLWYNMEGDNWTKMMEVEREWRESKNKQTDAIVCLNHWFEVIENE